MTTSRIERIKELFLKLKSGYDWCQKNERNNTRKMVLAERSENIFDELEKLGVDRLFSECVFFFGPKVDYKLFKQFEKD